MTDFLTRTHGSSRQRGNVFPVRTGRGSPPAFPQLEVRKSRPVFPVHGPEKPFSQVHGKGAVFPQVNKGNPGNPHPLTREEIRRQLGEFAGEPTFTVKKTNGRWVVQERDPKRIGQFGETRIVANFATESEARAWVDTRLGAIADVQAGRQTVLTKRDIEEMHPRGPGNVSIVHPPRGTPLLDKGFFYRDTKIFSRSQPQHRLFHGAGHKHTHLVSGTARAPRTGTRETFRGGRLVTRDITVRGRRRRVKARVGATLVTRTVRLRGS